MNRRLTYVYTWPGEKKPVGLAMNCHMKNGMLLFFSTYRGHGIEGKITKDGEDAFTFVSEGMEPGPWEFKKLTIEEFRRQIWKMTDNGGAIARTIKTTDDLQEWYRKQFGEEAGLNYPDVLDN